MDGPSANAAEFKFCASIVGLTLGIIFLCMDTGAGVGSGVGVGAGAEVGSGVVVGLIFAWFYNPNFGLLAYIFLSLGLEPIAILSDEELVTYGIIFAGLWPQIAYCMILYLTGLSNVSKDLMEAARLDGAKGIKMLWHVVLPQLRPATFISVVVTVIGALRSFDMVAIMTEGGPYGSSNVLAYYMYETALSEYGFRLGYGSAIATVLFFIMLIYISYFLWRLYKNEREV